MGHQETSDRKKDHIELAFKSAIANQDSRFYYEPLFAGHPEGNLPERSFVGKKLLAPIWISSMTGGTKEAATINKNLAKVCGQYGLGMGLGSCRIILESDECKKSFRFTNKI